MWFSIVKKYIAGREREKGYLKFFIIFLEDATLCLATLMKSFCRTAYESMDEVSVNQQQHNFDIGMMSLFFP